MRDRFWGLGIGLAIMLLAAAPAVLAVEKTVVYEMEKVSIFDSDAPQQGLIGGQMARCGPTPDPAVKKYPEMKSKRPIYGKVMFDGSPLDTSAGKVYYFAVDESGEVKKEKADKAAAKVTAVPPPNTAVRRIRTSAIVAPNVQNNFDLLYFDANGDLDLTNDPVIRVMKDPPASIGIASRMTVFDTLSVDFDFGPGAGKQAVKIVPRLTSYSTNLAYLRFGPTEARKGKIRLGDKEYDALLSQTRMITGRFDRANTGLQLMPADGSPRMFRSSYDLMLGTMRSVGDEFYEITASPSGDRLTVGPFKGEAGTMTVDPGGRDIDKDKLAVRGVLISKKRALTLGDMSSPLAADKSREYRIPADDYSAPELLVDYGRLSITLSPNPYSLDKPGTLVRKPAGFGIKVRKDKPFKLDFAAKPKLVFSTPAKEVKVTAGQSITLRALVIEPGIDMLFRGLKDTTNKVGERKYGIAGKEVLVPQYASLDPTLVITDSSGKQVAEGKMPFG